MILILEQDKREYDGRRFIRRPMFFKGIWNGKKTWRVGWGFWSLSYYPEPGLRDFFRYVEGGNTSWKDQ